MLQIKNKNTTQIIWHLQKSLTPLKLPIDIIRQLLQLFLSEVLSSAVSIRDDYLPLFFLKGSPLSCCSIPIDFSPEVSGDFSLFL